MKITCTICIFRPQLQAANLQPVQLTELETEFSKIEGQKAVPVRYIKSQQAKQAQLAVEVAIEEGIKAWFLNVF